MLSNIFSNAFVVVVCFLSFTGIISAFLLKTSIQANIYFYPVLNQLLGMYIKSI
jgi:hypothetical protein